MCKVKGVTKGVYIPVDLEGEVFRWSEEWGQVKGIIQEICRVQKSIIKRMVNRLIRMKCLEKFRLLGKYYLGAIDGTGHLVFKKRHCRHCLVRRKEGKVPCQRCMGSI